MTKNQQLAERVAATFFEGGVSYLAVNQTSLNGNLKLLAIGTLSAALSAAYNILRQSNPTVFDPPTPPASAMNGVAQLTAPAPAIVAPSLPPATEAQASDEATASGPEQPPA